jgi:hypothetical protein
VLCHGGNQALFQELHSGRCILLLPSCMYVPGAGAVALELYEALTGLQQEKIEDPFGGWVVPVEC